MDIHKKRMIDHVLSLDNESHNTFCDKIVELDLEGEIVNDKQRRIQAYRLAYPETTVGVADHVINTRATTLMRRRDIRDRIAFLYEEEGTSVENQYRWTRGKAEKVLVSIATSDNEKTSDIIKAVDTLNKMRGIDAPEVLEEEEEDDGDTIDAFFNKFRDNE
ncbi:MAG: hypothetical protein RR744_00110 [Cellulosilyticaceae bacterium]